MHEERRAFLRVESDVAVICTPLDADGERGRPFRTISLDVSAGGRQARRRRAGGSRPAAVARAAVREPPAAGVTEATVVRVAANRSFAVAFDELETYTQQRVVCWVYNQDRRLFERHAQARIPLRMRAVCDEKPPTTCHDGVISPVAPSS